MLWQSFPNLGQHAPVTGQPELFSSQVCAAVGPDRPVDRQVDRRADRPVDRFDKVKF